MGSSRGARGLGAGSTKKDVPPLFNVVQNAPNVHTVVFDNIREGWEMWGLLRADAHHDNAHCDQDFEKRHLDEAVRREAFILDVGDLHCAMQGKYDPRSSKEACRPEHQRDDYLDALIETETPFYQPYARNFIVIARGNHETSIKGRHGTDLTDRLCAELRKVPGANVAAGGYGGWVRFQFRIHGTTCRKKTLKYFHGGGGGAIMTSGTLDNRRQASFLPDADIIVNGHTHDQYILPLQRERLSENGHIEQDALWCIRTGTYKDEYGDGSGGWHVERRGPPKPIGAVWLHFILEDAKNAKIRVEATSSLRNG